MGGVRRDFRIKGSEATGTKTRGQATWWRPRPRVGGVRKDFVSKDPRPWGQRHGGQATWWRPRPRVGGARRDFRIKASECTGTKDKDTGAKREEGG